MDFNIETELRELITSIVDLNKAGCEHSEIVTDIAPIIQTLYKQGEFVGFLKGCNTVAAFIKPRREAMAIICGDDGPRVKSLDETLEIIEEVKERQRKCTSQKQRSLRN